MSTETARTHSGTTESRKAVSVDPGGLNGVVAAERGPWLEADTEYRLEAFLGAAGFHLDEWQRQILRADPAKLRHALDCPVRRPRLGDLCAAHHAIREQQRAKRRAKLRAIHAAYRAKTRRRNRRTR
jgi:hypothetical protein